MDVIAYYTRRAVNDEGRTEITFTLSSFADNEQIKQLEKNAPYKLKISPRKSKRTLKQNNLMWAMISEIAIATCGENATSDDEWDVYINALEKANAKCTIIACYPDAIPMLKQAYRATRVLNYFTSTNGVEMAQCKVFYGSSHLDTEEMAKLLDVILDMGAEVGVYPIYE